MNTGLYIITIQSVLSWVTNIYETISVGMDSIVGTGVEFYWFVRFSFFGCNICRIWWMDAWMVFYDLFGTLKIISGSGYAWVKLICSSACYQLCYDAPLCFNGGFPIISETFFIFLLSSLHDACITLLLCPVCILNIISFSSLSETYVFLHITVVTHELWLLNFLLLQLH